LKLSGFLPPGMVLRLLLCCCGMAVGVPSYECASALEDWPSIHRRLLRLLDGQGGTSTLAPELERASISLTRRIDFLEHERVLDLGDSPDCVPGRISLDLLLLLSQPGLADSVHVWKAGGLLDSNWQLLTDWPALARAAWPLFRLLRLLQKQAEAQGAAELLPGCGEEEDAFAAILANHVRRRQISDEALSAASSFLTTTLSTDRCAMSTAAAYLTSAWVRFPVFDDDTEDVLRIAESYAHNLSLARILVTRHPLLDMLDDVASSYQAFMIDSGALYVDQRFEDAKANETQIDYTRHMMMANAYTPQEAVECHPESVTPMGRCNPFARLGNALLPWQKGVAQEDTIRAILATYKDNVPRFLVFRLVEGEGGSAELRLLATKEVMELQLAHELADCLADTFVTAVAVLESMPRLEIVVSFQSGPLVPRMSDTWMSPYGRRQAKLLPSLSCRVSFTSTATGF